MQELNGGLTDEGIRVVDFAAEPGGLEVAVEATPASDSQLESVLNLGSDASGTFEYRDVVDGVVVNKVFDIHVLQLDEENVRFRLTDPRTGESAVFSGDDLHTSVPVAIPVFLGGVAVGEVLYWLAVGTAIVVGTALLVKATDKVIDKVKADARKKPDKKYFQAAIRGNYVLVGGNGVTYKTAISQGKTGRNFYTPAETDAKNLAKSVGNGARPIGSEHHKPKLPPPGIWLRHYHPSNRVMHAFYGLPV
ncbi:MAG: hypothetical protein LBJ02_07715 [Bifidobacteriaceae bacterium]|nr:hypothetical protein [Bifidobacteriaceae bacterium]